METLNFRIGNDAGLLLMRIAQEHLIYNYDIEKALKVFTDSFGEECPEELKLSLLKGSHVLLVDEESQLFLVDKRDELANPGHSIFPFIDFSNWVIKKQKELKDSGSIILELFKTLELNNTTNISLNLKSIIDLVKGNSDKILDELSTNEYVERIYYIIKESKRYIEDSIKLNKIFIFLKKSYKLSDLHIDNDGTLMLTEIMQNVKDLCSYNFDNLKLKYENKDISKFIESQHDIDTMINNGISPVNILDNYSAGWLSQDGTFYGLNGEISHMLHNQIADALYNSGIIPLAKKNEINPEQWLDENGWVKIHGNWILYEGYLHNNIPLSKEQINIIYKYGQMCHNGMLRLGIKQEYVSAVRFEMTDPLQFKTNYFKI